MLKAETGRRRRGHGLDRRSALKIGAGGVAFAAGGGVFSSTARAADRASSFGVYSGYSAAAYDGWVRTSLYAPVRDGVKLAVDIYRPTRGKVLHKGRLPVVWQPKRYQRAIVHPDGSLTTVMESNPRVTASYAYATARRLIEHGYIVVSVDRRGTGASFGVRSETADPIDATDGYDITEWLAKQPWCDGKIGMFGASYEGEMQLRVAATAPPHLKAIMPEVSPVDWYRVVAAGGIPKKWQFSQMISAMDANPNNGPVDADKDRSLLNAALAAHRAGNDYSALADKLPFRDSKNPVTGEQHWLKRHGGVYAAGLSASNIAVYHRVGWFAGVMIDQIVWYASQKGPKKLLVGPWGGGAAVTEEEYAQWTNEAHRWFDYWLKGVQNGIMEEPSIHSSVPNAHTRKGGPWRGLPAVWPLPNERRTEFYFQAGRSGSSKSVNDGKLALTKPQSAGRDDYTVKYDCQYKGGSEPAAPGKAPVDHADFDAQGLTYTTDPLDADVEVTGHPVVRLWVESTANDGDLFVKLEDVDAKGVSTHVAQGQLRASRRALRTPPYEYFGLPWNSCYESDVQLIPKGEAVEMAFALLPTSYIYQRGHRIRVTITCSDLEWAPSPQISPAPVVAVHRTANRASSITLPIIPT